MQQREQRILKKLAEAREAQSSAMSRIIQARARLMQVEARLQALHARHAPTPTVIDQPLASTPPSLADTSSNPAIPEPASAATQMIVPPVNTPHISAQTTDPFTSASSSSAMQTPPLAEQARPSDAKAPPITEQSSSKATAPMPALDEPTSILLDEDEEETQKMPSLRFVRSVSAQQNSGAEEKQLTVRSTSPQSEQRAQNADDKGTREAGASDTPTKAPVIRQERDQMQEPL